MESRCHSDMDEHKQRLDREYEGLLQSQSRELDALMQRHQKERDKQVRNMSAIETRRRRQIQQQQDADMKVYLSQQKKDYTQMKENVRKVNVFTGVCIFPSVIKLCVSERTCSQGEFN